MADNLDPEIVAQFQEAMRQATEAARELPMAMNATIEAINKATGSLKKNTQATDADTAAEEKAAATTKAKTALEEAEEEALKKILKAQALQEAALSQAKNSLISFGDALLSGTRGFEKYGQAMRGAGDAAYDFGKSLGPLGAVLGGIVKGATMVGSAMMKQADDVLKATDDLSKMGTAGAFSAEQVRKMGTGLGLASDQLDKFTKPVKSLGASLISLGGNAADGTKQFAELAKVTSEQRQAYQRLGVSQEELIQNTADYINLQTQQGRQITEQMKRDGTLKNAAREYTDNLLELAALTGKDIDAVKKKNELAMAEIETAIQNNLLDQEINRLRKMDTAESRARADQLEKERKARDKLLQRVENEVGDPALRKGLAKFLATGAITEEVAALKRIGVPVEEFAAKIKQGKDVSDEFMDSLSKNGDAMMKNIGTAALYDENTRKAFGVSAEYLNYLAKARDRDEKSQSDLVKARIAETKAGKGPAGEDPAQKARNALTEAEIKAKVALDDLVASANPLLNSFDNMNIATKALIVAAGVATAALGLMAAAALKNAAQGAMNTLRGAGGEVLDKVKGIGGPSVARAAKIGGGIAAVGMGAYQMYAGNKDIEEQEKRGEISSAVAREKKQDNTYGAAGGTAGALVGGALGSMLGPLGTVVGGYLGQMAGEKIGKWAASWDDDKNPELADSKKAAEAADKKVQLERERIAQEQAASDQSVSEAERKLAATRLAAIQKQEAQLLYEEALRDLKKAATKEETDAALAKSDRAQKQLAELKSQDAVRKIENASTELEKKNAEEQLIQARRHSALIDENRAIWNLKNAKTDEEKKAIQAQIDQIRKNRDEEIAALTGKKDEKSAEATSAGKPDQGYGPPVFGSGRLVTVEDTAIPKYADGGTIPDGKLGIVGEKGPELITGPAGVLNAEQIRKAIEMGGVPAGLNLNDTGMAFASTGPFAKVMLAYETRARNDKAFQKRIQDALKGSASGKLSPYETLAFALETVEGQRWAAENDFGIDISESMDKGPNKEIRSYFNQILKQMDKEAFAGMFANGGSIPQGKFGVVGEAGPELVSGPATVTSQKQIAEQFATQSEDLIDSFDETGESVQMFDTELSSFVRDDPVGKMTKQLNTVTEALEDLNELMDPMGPGGLDAVGPAAQPNVPSAQSIISAVLGGIAGILGGRGKTAGSAGAGGSGFGGASSSSGGAAAGSTGGAGSAETTSPGASSVESSIPTAMPSGGSGVGPDGETQQGMEVRIGRELRKGGTVSWRTNNPGNISYGALAKKYGAIGRWIKPDGDQQQRTTGIAIFPTEEHGNELKKALWRRPLYIDKTIDEGVMKWTGTQPPGSGYARDLARAANASLGTRIRDLTDQQLQGMVDKQKHWEGFKAGQISQAALGGIFSGPTTGYPVEMHGTELVTRLDPNSLLEKLAKTPAQQIEQQTSQPAGSTILSKTDDTMKEVAAINAQMMEMLAEKLDTMINKLDTGNETQEKLLKFSQV